MNHETNNNKNMPATIIFAVFAAVLLIAFLAYRGGDIGQLPGLVANLGGGTVFGNGVIGHLLDGLKVFALVTGWFFTGFLILLFVKPPAGDPYTPLRMDGIVSIALGAAVWSLIWFFLGLAGLYSTSTALVVSLISLGLMFLVVKILRGRGVEEDDKNKLISIFTAKHAGDSEAGEPGSFFFDKLVIGLIYVQVALSFIASMAPPIAKDTLLYHFAVPKAFVAQGNNAFVDGNIASYLSLGTEMHVVWARLLADRIGVDAASGVVVWLFFPLLLQAVYWWAREIGISRRWSLIASAIVATVPTGYHVASSGYIDLSLALYVTLATYALTRWWRTQSWSWVVLIAIFLGAALSVKLTAVFVFAAFALIVLLRARATKNPVAPAPGSDTAAASTTRRIVVTGFAALLLAGAIASPWYIRTWVATGSPVFPFYMSIWPGKANGWDLERSTLFQAINSQYGGTDVDKVNYLIAPVRVSVAAQPEQPANYDGVLGVAFLIGLPLLVWALWKFEMPVEVKIAAGVAAIMYLFWLFSSEQLRYLLPIVPVLAIAIAASVETIGQRIGSLKTVAQYAFVAAAICGLLTTAAWFCRTAPVRVALGGETRDQYLTRNLDYYPFYQTINTESPADARVWLINMRRDTYNLDRPAYSDYLFEDWTLRKLVWESRNSQELRAKAAAMNVQYVLTRYDFLFDYDRSTLVDDKKPRAENEAKLRLAKEFILDPARVVRSDNKFSLIKVF